MNADIRHPAAARMRYDGFVLWTILAALVPLAILHALGTGRVELGLVDVAKLLFDKALGRAADPYQTAIVLNARLPRILIAAFAGAGLAMAGAALQGCFRNPLAGPQTIGVLNGAGFGGAVMIFLGFGPAAIMLGAFGAGFLTVLLVIWIAKSSGGTSILTLVLSGVVVGAMLAAFTTLLQYFADPERQLPQLVYWLMGSFSRGNLENLAWIAAPIAIGMTAIWAYAFRLDVLAGGEEEAEALGLSVARDRTILLIAVALIVAAVVSAAGIIGWVGLVVPHIARLLVGPAHRRLIPASALIGAAYLVGVDTLARSATAAELPAGAVTALVGAPIFVAIMRFGFGRRADT
jgi:iron complex transport system permease protein